MSYRKEESLCHRNGSSRGWRELSTWGVAVDLSTIDNNLRPRILQHLDNNINIESSDQELK